jgi:hypothetical protein
MSGQGGKKNMGGRMFGMFGLIAAAVFLPTTVLLGVAMLPAIVAAIADRNRYKLKALTIGAMNLAGCTPFLISLWAHDNTITGAVTLVANPQTLVVVWMAASVGYLIDWSMSGIVSTVMTQRAGGRLKEIQKRQGELVQRWGDEVTGDIPLDRYGFRIERPDDDETPAVKDKGAKSNKKMR